MNLNKGLSTMYRIDYKENKGKCIVAVNAIKAGLCILELSPDLFVPLYVKFMSPRSVHEEQIKQKHSHSAKEARGINNASGTIQTLNGSGNQLNSNFDRVTKICFHCFKKIRKTVICPVCRYVMYCSEGCLEDAWKLHRAECDIYKLNIFDRYAPSPEMRLVINSFLYEMDYSDFCGSTSCIAKEDYTKYKFMAYIIASAIMNRKKKSFEQFDTNEAVIEHVLELFVKVTLNSFTVLNNDLEPVGLAIYRKPANFFNHSCVSNCVATFLNRRLFIRALFNINAGDELTISYLDTALDQTTRRSICLKRYLFHCSCKLCSYSVSAQCHTIFNNELVCSNSEECKKVLEDMENVLISELERKSGEAKKKDFKIYPIYRRGNENKWKCMLCKMQLPNHVIKNVSEKEKECVQEAMHLDVMVNRRETYDRKAIVATIHKLVNKLEFLTNYFHHTRYSILKMKSKILQVSVELEEYKLAYDLIVHFMRSVEIMYGKMSPYFGYCFFLRGKLALYLNSTEEGLECLRQAKKIIARTHGVESHLCGELDDLLKKYSPKLNGTDRNH